MEETIERYKRRDKSTQDTSSPLGDQNAQQLKHEAQRMMKKIEQLETSKRKLLGEGLGTCGIQELQKLERQLDRSNIIIRARKTSLYRKQMEKLKEKLRLEPHQISSDGHNATVPVVETSEVCDVETTYVVHEPAA